MAVTWWMPVGLLFIFFTPFPGCPLYCVPLLRADALAPESSIPPTRLLRHKVGGSKNPAVPTSNSLVRPAKAPIPSSLAILATSGPYVQYYFLASVIRHVYKWGMELKDLRYFMAAAEESSFSWAAQRLHMTQPLISLDDVNRR